MRLDRDVRKGLIIFSFGKNSSCAVQIWLAAGGSFWCPLGRERERESVCVCVRETERQRERECVCERDRERERQTERERERSKPY
jgi:hypothetical protein